MLWLPCQDLAAMALDSLTKATGCSADYFETISDCLHMGNLITGFHLPQYVDALLAVRVSCLFVLDHLDSARSFDRHGNEKCAAEEARHLIDRLSALEAIVGERVQIEKDLGRTVQSIKSENASKMKTARANRPIKHDWAAVEKLERKLLAEGRNRRDWAGIIFKRMGIPPVTYRAWRNKR